MAVRQVTVPYARGYDFGIGADLSSGSPMGKVVVGEATPVEHAGGATVDFQIQRIHETSELEQALGIDVEASYGCAAFGAGVSARFSFAKNAKVQTSSLFLSVTTQVELGFLSIDDPSLAPDAASLVDRPDVFEARYGNVFVRGIGRGGLFVGVLRIETGSSEESEHVSTELEGSYGLFSAEASAKFDEVQRKYRNEVFVRMYHEGGPTDLKITDPTDPVQLLGNANRFLESFQTTPDAVARPYFVTLAPVAIARGPLPPNPEVVRHAQDVLVQCAKRRSALLDQLNLLEFIADNPGKFDYTGGADPAAVRDAARNAQIDLELVADCAAAAMDHPASATMPAAFAQARGTTFPTVVMPDPMPQATGAKVVEVPDFAGCTTWSACVEKATAAGLAVVRQIATLPEGEFGVLSVAPPAGTPLPEGSTVTIVTHPVKPSRLSHLITTHARHFDGVLDATRIGG